MDDYAISSTKVLKGYDDGTGGGVAAENSLAGEERHPGCALGHARESRADAERRHSEDADRLARHSYNFV